MNSLTMTDFRPHSAKALRFQSSLYSVSKGLSCQVTYLGFFFPSPNNYKEGGNYPLGEDK